MDLFEKRVWRGFPPLRVFPSVEAANEVYRGGMEAILSVSPGNEHGLDVAKGLIEGSRGFARDHARAKQMLMGLKAPFTMG